MGSLKKLEQSPYLLVFIRTLFFIRYYKDIHILQTLIYLRLQVATEASPLVLEKHKKTTN